MGNGVASTKIVLLSKQLQDKDNKYIIPGRLILGYSYGTFNEDVTFEFRDHSAFLHLYRDNATRPSNTLKCKTCDFSRGNSTGEVPM